MEKNTGKVREKSGNFVSPEKWEPCVRFWEWNVHLLYMLPNASSFANPLVFLALGSWRILYRQLNQ